MQAFQNPATLTGEQREAAMYDPHGKSERHFAPSIDETARIREYLAAKYGPNVATPEGQAPHL
ncbi:hypothetical protein WK57_11235 [Burkholderia ubonensis]|uniref:Uncharacterized protein n=2 Tax=Burkholderia ubonensis TaxID=101571 RepID=A0AA40UZS1_9BURK|nr:hypothetical protein WI85_28265 [Burkholderia ubonensis]KWZ61076.1 hypothetical protein WK57_11235 [Burkholderia ubonensis]